MSFIYSQLSVVNKFYGHWFMYTLVWNDKKVIFHSKGYYIASIIESYTGNSKDFNFTWIDSEKVHGWMSQRSKSAFHDLNSISNSWSGGATLSCTPICPADDTRHLWVHQQPSSRHH